MVNISEQQMRISERQEKVITYLKEHDIPFTCYNHPEGKTIEEAKQWWRADGSVHCKNLFFRNHKGNRHYLVCFIVELAEIHIAVSITHRFPYQIPWIAVTPEA